MKLDELTSFLDEYLAIYEYADDSLNGLQVEGEKEVSKIALAVDACSETFLKAASLKADMLIVHHGIFWGKQFPLTGIHAQRIKSLIGNGISLYAAHLPLDIHREIGNNAGIIQLLGLEMHEPFGTYKGSKAGYIALCRKPVPYDTMIRRLRKKIGVKPVDYHFGSDLISKIAVVSGGGASTIWETPGTGIDLLLTGELSHVSYHLAKEMQVNIAFCGHYATETIGVRKLGEILEQRFSLDTIFIDVPTGM